MMPEMDGLELCKKIKTNLETSHIPIILLTARTTDDYKLKGT
jgi:CheY-like chemotaxis protein